MKFYLPFNDYPNAKPDIETYNIIADGVEEMIGQKISRNSKIYSLSFVRDGIKRNPTVGEVFAPIGQPVICIFKGSSTYLVCTQDRGVLRGEPYLVGLNETSAERFNDTSD